MPRKRRPFIRPDAFRDSRLVIIAAEDTKATVSYFETLRSSAFYQNPQVHVEILPRTTTASSPEHVLEQLSQWRQEYQIAENDELWLVIDVDNWGDAKLSRISQICNQKNFFMAVSNPAIELWFLLHITNVKDEYSAQQRQVLFENKKVNANRTALEQVLIEKLGKYNKSNFDAVPLMVHIHLAILHAKDLEINPNDRWPQQLGTQVYRLVESILDLSRDL